MECQNLSPPARGRGLKRATEDHREGVIVFLEEREPVYKGS